MADDKEAMDTCEIEDSLSSADSEDEEAESKNLYTYLQALQNINTNKYSYNDYIQLVDAAFLISDLDKIRESYDLFAAVFPIAPQLWLKRLKIEASLASTSEDMIYVDSLFKKALKDYFSADIALEYADFLSKLPNPINYWNETLFPYALDCMKGSELFKYWRENVYSTLAESPEKVQAIYDFFETEIQIPLFNLDDTYIAFKEFYGKNSELLGCDWNSIEEKYQKTRKILQTILPFEKKLQTIDKSSHQERAMVFKQYIDLCKSELDPKILIVLYERMATECCLDASVWLEYLAYVEENEAIFNLRGQERIPSVFSQSSLELVSRALRNCTWNKELYIEKMRLLEINKAPKEEVQTIIEEASMAGFQSPVPMVGIWLEYLTYLARNTDYQKVEERENLRRNFQFAWDTLGRDWGVLADVECKILQYWSKLEYGKLGSAIKGRDLWYTVMESADNSQRACLWIEFAYLELQRGLEPARKIYKRAVSTPNIDNLESIVSSWIQFERCYGSLQQLKTCENFCLPILAHHIQRKQSKKSDKKPSTNEQPENSQKTTVTTESTKVSKPVKRKTEANNSTTTKKDEQPESGNRKKKMKADVEELPVALENVNLGQEPHKASEVIDTTKDHVTIFVSNLNYDITEEKIIAAFPELKVKSVNLIKKATGKTRGFGYIELESEIDVEKALSLDRREIDGRPVYISKISRDKNKRKSFKYANDIEPNKLFVKGLPFEMKKYEVEELFRCYGQLKEVRMVVHKSGKSKGFAYVEYEKESDASTAILKLDQKEIRGNTISVAISAPPPRGKPNERKDTSPSRPSSLGGAKRANTLGEAKPRISLIPTIVQKNAIGGKAEDKPKTNEEFRKLLLNK